MYTNRLIQQSMTSVDVSGDLSAIRRILVAAALSSQFCNSLLEDPSETVCRGFGGERFLVSEPTMDIMNSVCAKTLAEFIYQLDEKLSNTLLGADRFRTDA